MSSRNKIHLFVNPVRSDRAEEWEEFYHSQILPAVAKHRPELNDRVRVFRDDESESGTTTFVFYFEGGDLDDYDLVPLFTAAHGSEEGQRLLETWQAMFSGDQYGWTLHEVAK